MTTVDNSSFMGRNEFLLRRLHSLSGLVPVGAYMIVHLTVNASVAIDHNLFQKLVYQIHTLGWVLPAVEWCFIFIPILFHAIYGVMIVQGGQNNVSSYRTQGNVRYWLQRVTGMVAFAFIMLHVFHMHGWFHFEVWADFAKSMGGMKFAPYNASSTASDAMQSPIITGLYLVGVLSCIFHLANGIWTMGITWGLWTTPKAQERANYLCVAVGGLLTILTIASVVGLHRVDSDQARQDEDAMYEKMNEAGWITDDSHKRASHEAHEGEHKAPPAEEGNEPENNEPEGAEPANTESGDDNPVESPAPSDE